jgi:AcrR family transcriptional regulator
MARVRPELVDSGSWPTRELILIEASRLFASRGYLGTSTRDIAAAVGIRQPSLYSHFRSKQEIAEELLRRDLSDGIATLRRLAIEGDGAAVQLYRYLLWEVTNVLETPIDLRALYLREILDLPEFAAGRRLLARYERLVAALLERGMGEGDFLVIDVSFAQRAVDAIILETIRGSAESFGHVHDEPDLAASFVVRALLARPSRLASVRAAAHRAEL